MIATEVHDIRELARKAAAFRKELLRVKRRLGSKELQWYPYDTLQVFPVLDKLLTGAHRDLLGLAGADPVLDIGCGDGDSAFFFESLGRNVDAIDYAPTNYNQMRGVAALARELKSSVGVYEMDLDSFFGLPRNRYGLTICHGLLYHLKNPYYLLEKLARVSRYCLLSTRVARLAPDHHRSFHEIPVAYLVDDLETNNDPTNFWIFSEAGLRRIFARTRWELCDYLTIGCREGSDPVSPDRDERAYCLLRSPALDRPWSVTLLDGWHALEGGHFRWTKQRFSVKLETSSAAPCSELSLLFHLPKEHLAKLGPVTLSVAVNGNALPGETYTSHGEHTFSRRIPPGLADGARLHVDFALDKALAPGARDARELGVAISFAHAGCAVSDANLPLTLS
jgi:SAM-dependent methyltransferase